MHIYVGCGKKNALNLEYMNLSYQPSERHLGLVTTLGNRYVCVKVDMSYIETLIDVL